MSDSTDVKVSARGRPRPEGAVRSGCVAVLAVWAGMAAAGEPAVLRPAAGRPLPTGRPAAKVDPAVTPAGGDRALRCGQCGRAACPHCRLPGGHSKPHSRCQHGMCPAHCPVRPDVFGFYGTQWRRWPGAGVLPASANEAAAPARPARSQLPSAAEESLPQADPADEPAAAPAVDVPQDDAKPSANDATDDAAADETAPLNSTAWRSFTAAARQSDGP